MIGASNSPIFLIGKGVTAKNQPQTLRQLFELAGLTKARLVSIKGGANSLAAAQFRLEKTFQVNGHQAVYIALGDDKASQRLLQRLEGAPFLPVQASYASRLTAMADVVLPAASCFEYDAVIAPPYYPVVQVQQRVARIGECRSDYAMIEGLARACLSGIQNVHGASCSSRGRRRRSSAAPRSRPSTCCSA